MFLQKRRKQRLKSSLILKSINFINLESLPREINRSKDGGNYFN